MKVQSAWRLVSPCISRSLSPPKIIRFLLMVFIVALLGAMGDGAFPVETVTAATTPQTEPINPHSDLIFRHRRNLLHGLPSHRPDWETY